MSNKDRKTHAENLKGENLKGENLKGENLKGENLKGENLRSTWTKEQVDLLKKLVLEKKTYAEIYSKFPRVVQLGQKFPNYVTLILVYHYQILDVKFGLPKTINY
jgi:hypothetical protein